MKLLYAEDEKAMSEAVCDILRYHKYNVDAVYDGAEALYYARNEEYDGIILDIMMPEADGFEVLSKLCAEGNTTPVLLLTAKDDVEDKVTGLDLGADDYLAKPFAMAELLARIRAMLRRKEIFTPDVLSLGNVTLDMQSYELSVGDKSFLLAKIEYQMMELFLRNKGTYLSTQTLLEKVWGFNTDAEIGIVWVYISYLRKKLADLGADVEIKVRRNIGYILEEK